MKNCNLGIFTFTSFLRKTSKRFYDNPIIMDYKMEKDIFKYDFYIGQKKIENAFIIIKSILIRKHQKLN